jgi:GH43 family beta-xylosidase
MKRSQLFLMAAITFTILASALAAIAEEPGRQPHTGNPILPGYYADPSLVQHDGKFYLYATLDPWGDKTLGCWESADFQSWSYRVLNWPTKDACKSPTSGGAAVWAPSVVRAANGKFNMYVSVHNEVWAGTADHPLGPWRNALGDRPLIPGNFKPGFHMIDAEGFVDDDGTGWLYWGSGWGWKNGRCWAVKLQPDMVTFDGQVHDVTPANYFEGPIMVKRDGRYFLMYSNGITVKDTYRVHYAVGDNPLGPFVEPANSPILVTDHANNVISPGHHTVFRQDGKDYILYHRHSIPFDPKFVGRQVCVDELKVTPDGLIEQVVPTHAGPALIRGRTAGRARLPATATASSEAGLAYVARDVLDDNYATRWSLAPEAKGGWLQLDFGASQSFSRQEIRFEYAWKPYRFLTQVSDDGQQWRMLADHSREAVTGSPIAMNQRATARYLRLLFSDDVSGQDVSIFEWEVYP